MGRMRFLSIGLFVMGRRKLFKIKNRQMDLSLFANLTRREAKIF